MICYLSGDRILQCPINKLLRVETISLRTLYSQQGNGLVRLFTVASLRDEE